MSDAFWIVFWPAFFAGLPQVIGSFTNLVVTLRGRKKQRELVHRIDGRVDELVTTTKGLSHAEGKAEGVEAERTRAHDVRRDDQRKNGG
jgi:hypothetical protein